MIKMGFGVLVMMMKKCRDEDEILRCDTKALLTSVSLFAKSVSLTVGVRVDEYNELDDDFDEVLLVEDASIFSTSASSSFPSPGKLGLTLVFMIQLRVSTFCMIKLSKEKMMLILCHTFLITN